MLTPLLPLWAVHISDGVLTWPWLLGGFVVAGLLALIACWRLSDEDVPRVALLAAAFFVASSIHVRFPGSPTSVHLLLNGLVGVVLGWRAPLAILLGVTLQALLISHGGLSTIGVNTCTEAIPALACGLLFPLLRFGPGGSPWTRRALLGTGALLWGGCFLIGLAVLWTTPLADLFRTPTSGGTPLLDALGLLAHPLALSLLIAFAAGCSLLKSSRELALGVLLGVASVLGTVLLTGLVLLLDGREKWGPFVSLVLIAHLPLALLEGVILGTTVQFLARVKPEMLGIRPGLAAVVCVLCLGGPAWAHGLGASYRIDHEKRTVTITAVYDTSDRADDADVEVKGPDGVVIVKGKTDRDGRFTFRYDTPGPIEVRIIDGGHATRVRLSEQLLAGEAPEAPATGESRLRDLAVGVALLLALAAFVQSWLTGRRLKRLEEGRPS